MGSTFDGSPVVQTNAPTAAQINRVRAMTGEPLTTTYTDADISERIILYPCVDENGEAPRVPSTTTPGTMMENPDWMATYDLNAAAGLVWQEKAAVLACAFDFSADGGDFKRSQAYENAQKQARYYLSRRNPKTITLTPDVARERTYEIGNSPEA